jgi:hypothetical protein
MTLVWCNGPMNEWLLEKFAEVFGAALAEAASAPLAASTAAPVAAIVVMTAADRLLGFFMGQAPPDRDPCLAYGPCDRIA